MKCFFPSITLVLFDGNFYISKNNYTRVCKELFELFQCLAEAFDINSHNLNDMKAQLSYHNQDTIHAEKTCMEMHASFMTALMFRTCRGIEARTSICAEIVHFATQCIFRTRKVRSLRPHATQALMMHLIRKCAISALARIRAI